MRKIITSFCIAQECSAFAEDGNKLVKYNTAFGNLHKDKTPKNQVFRNVEVIKYTAALILSTFKGAQFSFIQNQNDKLYQF